MAAIESVDEVMDKIKLNVAQLGIATMKTLSSAMEGYDPKKEGKVSSTEFSTALSHCKLFLSKIDLSNIVKSYRTSPSGLVVDYARFLEDLSAPLAGQREKAVQRLFGSIKKKQGMAGDVILYSDLMALCDVQNHPDVKTGQHSPDFVRAAILRAFDSVQNENDEITLERFKSAFRGISGGYPYNDEAFVRFIQSCWATVFEDIPSLNLDAKEADEFVGQIEAMLVEKTRQKCKGSENEDRTLLRQFKHFSSYPSSETCSFEEFKRTLESYGVLAPAKELGLCFETHCSVDEKTGQKKLFYRTFITELFQKY